MLEVSIVYLIRASSTISPHYAKLCYIMLHFAKLEQESIK